MGALFVIDGYGVSYAVPSCIDKALALDYCKSWPAIDVGLARALCGGPKWLLTWRGGFYEFGLETFWTSTTTEV